jgi:hypothetical protein
MAKYTDLLAYKDTSSLGKSWTRMATFGLSMIWKNFLVFLLVDSIITSSGLEYVKFISDKCGFPSAYIIIYYIFTHVYISVF